MDKKRVLIPRSKIAGRRRESDIDSVANRSNNYGEKYRKDTDLLMEANRYWDSLAKFRQQRHRAQRYTYGDQWGDMIKVDGKYITEYQHICDQGCIPLQNNLIRRLVRNVMGVYRSQNKEPITVARAREEKVLGDVMSTLLQYVWQHNKMSEVLPRILEDFLSGGAAIGRGDFRYMQQEEDCAIDYVSPDYFFINMQVEDFRGWDVQFIGHIRDMSFNDLCSRFAKTREDYTRLKYIYNHANDKAYIQSYADTLMSSNGRTAYSFFQPNTFQTGMCRVYEIWRKERKPRYRCHDILTGDFYLIEERDYSAVVEAENNARRAQGAAEGMPADEIPLIETEWYIDSYWHYYYLTPLGHVIEEGETTYIHKSHPYVFKFYPFINGEVHSFVGDVIDQQRYVNRNITLHDMIVRSSSKGALIYQEGTINLPPEEIPRAWARPNAVIGVNLKPGQMEPHQTSQNNTNIGINELLQTQLRLFEDISGVHGAMQGKPGYSQTSGTLYAQQMQNATNSIVDILETFDAFVSDMATMCAKLIQQNYTDSRIEQIAGSTEQQVSLSSIRDFDFDMSVVQSTSSPAYRLAADAFLKEIWAAGQISLQQMLEVGNFPFADKLLQSIEAQRVQQAQEMQQGEMGEMQQGQQMQQEPMQ